MADFFNMGGHGFFIWSSYLGVLVVLLYNFLIPHVKRQKLIREIKADQVYLDRIKERK